MKVTVLEVHNVHSSIQDLRFGSGEGGGGGMKKMTTTHWKGPGQAPLKKHKWEKKQYK